MLTVDKVIRYIPTGRTEYPKWDESTANFQEHFNKIAEMKAWLEERYFCNFKCKSRVGNARIYATTDSAGYIVEMFCTYRKGGTWQGRTKYSDQLKNKI